MLRHSPSLAPLAPGAGIHLTPAHAASLGVDEGDEVDVTVGDRSQRLPVRIDPTLHEGSVYIPFNQPGVGPVGNTLEVGVSAGEPA